MPFGNAYPSHEVGVQQAVTVLEKAVEKLRESQRLDDALRIIGRVQRALHEICNQAMAFSDIPMGGGEAMALKQQMIGHLYGVIGHIVADDRNRIRLSLASDESCADRESLIRAIERVNGEIDHGYELPDEDAIAHTIRVPFDDGMARAITNSLRQLTAADVKAVAISPSRGRRSGPPKRVRPHRS